MKALLARLDALPLAAWQRAATWSAGAAVLLGLAASVGVRLLPLGPLWLAALVHPLLAALGFLCGAAGVVRGQQIDRRRWEIVDDATATNAEIQEAHREAERQRRYAGTAFLAAPIFLGYWGIYQFTGGLVAGLLAVTALAGYAVGFLLATRHAPPERGL